MPLISLYKINVKTKKYKCYVNYITASDICDIIK